MLLCGSFCNFYVLEGESSESSGATRETGQRLLTKEEKNKLNAKILKAELSGKTVSSCVIF